MNESIRTESEAPPPSPGFMDLLDDYHRFGYHCRAVKDDLPALRIYCSNLEGTISTNLIDVETLLTGIESDGDSVNCGLVGYALKNAGERIVVLDEIRSFVSLTISQLEASAKQGETS